MRHPRVVKGGVQVGARETPGMDEKGVPFIGMALPHLDVALLGATTRRSGRVLKKSSPRPLSKLAKRPSRTIARRVFHSKSAANTSISQDLGLVYETEGHRFESCRARSLFAANPLQSGHYGAGIRSLRPIATGRAIGARRRKTIARTIAQHSQPPGSRSAAPPRSTPSWLGRSGGLPQLLRALSLVPS